MDKTTVKLTLIKNGPVQLECDRVEIIAPDGSSTTKEGKLFLCRCGQSKSKPYCDGSHTKTGFEG